MKTVTLAYTPHPALTTTNTGDIGFHPTPVIKQGEIFYAQCDAGWSGSYPLISVLGRLHEDAEWYAMNNNTFSPAIQVDQVCPFYQFEIDNSTGGAVNVNISIGPAL